MVVPKDADVVDTTQMSQEQVVDYIVKRAVAQSPNTVTSTGTGPAL